MQMQIQQGALARQQMKLSNNTVRSHSKLNKGQHRRTYQAAASPNATGGKQLNVAITGGTKGQAAAINTLISFNRALHSSA
jgi:hypothetical protein